MFTLRYKKKERNNLWQMITRLVYLYSTTFTRISPRIIRIPFLRIPFLSLKNNSKKIYSKDKFSSVSFICIEPLSEEKIF